MSARSVARLPIPAVALALFAACGGPPDPKEEPGPRITSFTAAPDEIAPGDVATLSWRTTGAAQIEILDDAGRAMDLGSAVPAAGSAEVRPDADSTWRLVATAASGRKAEREATVRVRDADALRIVEFIATKATIDFGEASILSWTVTGATRINVKAGGEVLVEGAPAEGGVEVAPARRTTYELTAEGPGGTASASVAVAVRPVVSSFSTDETGPVPEGADVLLRWRTAGAERVVVTNGLGFVFDVPASGLGDGSVSAPVPPAGTFTITASLDGTEVVRDLQVDVIPLPAIAAFVAEPLVVTGSPGSPGTTRLSWETRGADTLELVATPGGPVDLGSRSKAVGSIDVSIEVGTVFELITGNAAGSTSSEAAVMAVEAPAIDSLRARPARVGSGETFELSWTTRGATSVELLDGAAALPVDPAAVNGAFTARIGSDTTFVLRASNSAGDRDERSIAVTVGAPIIVTFEADRIRSNPGETVTLTWENLGGVSLVVSGPDGVVPVCSTTDLAVIESGGCPFVAPAIGGRLELELAVENGTVEGSRSTLELEVDAGARILSFTPGSGQVSAGDPIELTWEVTADSLGRPAELRLTDDLGGAWDLDGSDPLQDSFVVTAATPGNRTFTLTATSLDGTADIAAAQVEILALPAVTLEAPPGAYDPDAGTPFQLAWTARDAANLAIFELDEAGAPIVPALFEAGRADLAAGSGVLDLEPVSVTTWSAIATNGLGRAATADASVQFIPLDLVSFEASPTAIVAGDPATLEWAATGVSRVDITNLPRDHVRGPTTRPFIDLSQSPTALELPYGDDCDSDWADEGCPILDFPDGFTFPFDGEVRDQARVYVNGFLSFDRARTGPSYDPDELPASGSPYAHVAPFWSDLNPHSTGRILYETRQSATGAFLVIQWSHYDFDWGDADLNFEVVLRETGDFEFRYGTMASLSPDEALGGEASIGHQKVSVTAGESVGYFDPILQPNTGYSFRLPSFGGAGTLDVSPAGTTTYDLTARGYDGATATSSITIVVHPRPVVSAQASVVEIDEGGSFAIAWETEDVFDLVILDDGAQVYVVPSSDVESGSVSLVAAGPGTHTFTAYATGALGRQVSVEMIVTVHAPFGLDSFEAADREIAVGGSTTLTWVTRGAEDFELTADGVPVDTTGLDHDSGALTVNPVNTAEYVLTVSRADGRSATERVTVRVVRASLDSVGLSASRIRAGGTVDLTWSASGAAGDPVGVRVIPSAMEELAAGQSPFEDIGPTGMELANFANQDGYAETVPFPAGFTFPFLGEEQHAIRVTADGFASFRTNQGALGQNRRLPDPGSGGVHLAPFWDDLHPYAAGHVFTALISDPQGDRFIVQWSHFDLRSPSGATGADLNFQIVLFTDGTFDFRYGTMGASTQDVADGAGATIGFQQTRARYGHLLSFDESVPGGLSDRTWRFDAFRPLAGTVAVSPGSDGRIEVCAVTEFDSDCQTLLVEVDGPGDLLISEIQLDPLGGPVAQWFELRNLSRHPVTLDGMEIVSGPAVHPIAPAAPTVIPPGEYVTLAAGATPGFVPGYVYGPGIPLDPAGGDLAIRFDGSTLASVEWDSSWTVTAGVSLTLDGAALSPANVLGRFTDPSMWCGSVEPYAASSFGTPGTAGAGCLIGEYDVDYFGPPSFIDISATGAPVLGLSGTYQEAEVPGGLPFAFPFYDAGLETRLFVGANGYIGFEAICFPPSGCFIDWDTGMIQVFAELVHQLQRLPGSLVSHQIRTIAGRRVSIVQWTGVGLWGLVGSITFQVQLWEGGDIVIAFDQIRGDDPAFFGASASVGLVSMNWNEWFFFTDDEPNLSDGRTLRYHFR